METTMMHRWTRPALALVALTVFGTACQETSLQALRAKFDIHWSEEAGFNEEEFELSVLQFGDVATGTLSSIEIEMANPGTANLDVCDVYLAVVTWDENGDLASETRVEADLEISTTIPPGEGSIPNGATVVGELRFTPLFGTPLAEGLQLVVKHELNWDCAEGAGEGLYIPIRGAGDGEPQPDIYSKPTEVTFPNVLAGNSSDEQDILVGNAGPGTLLSGDIWLDDDTHFALVPGTAANADFSDNEPRYTHVTFTPQTAGDHSTTLWVASNDPDEDPYGIPLFGIGDNQPVGKGPVAVCGLDYDSAPFQTVTFDGTASYDADGLGLQYSWAYQPPPGSSATLNPTNAATASSTLDLAGDYIATLTVTNANGQTDQCNQTVSAIPNENFRVELFWLNSGDDMDLHVLNVNNGSPRTDNDCYYANCQGTFGNLDWGVPGTTTDNPSLDLDDISGTGPENINIVQPATGPQYNGQYTVFVHDYPGSVYQAANDVTVNIYVNGALTQTFNFLLSGEDDDYYVATIDWPTGQVTPCFGLGGC